MFSIRSTRLLLVSNDIHSKGIGNQNDLVGSFYISQITGDICEIKFTPKKGNIIWNYETTIDKVYCRRNISISEKKQREFELLNLRGILTHPPAYDPIHCNAILSSMYLLKRFLAHRIPPEYSKKLADQKSPYEEISKHLRNVILDLPELCRFSSMWLNKRILSTRKIPSVSFSNRANILCILMQNKLPILPAELL